MSIGWQGNRITLILQVMCLSLSNFRFEKLNTYDRVSHKIVPCLCGYCGRVPALIELLTIPKRIRAERYFVTFCSILNLHNGDKSSKATRSNVAFKMYQNSARSTGCPKKR